MSTASDRGQTAVPLSALSEQLLALRGEVLGQWAARVRAEVKGAESLHDPILINTFPVLFGNLVEALTPDFPRSSAGVATPSVALEHGSERARLTRYKVGSVIAEYQILRQTLTDVLARHQVPVSELELRLISEAIDASIRESVTAFELAHSAFREQFVAALAHDLRNPLANASIAAQMVQRTGDVARIHEFAGMIRENLGRVDQMIRELLDTVIFQHGERLPLHPSRFDVAAIVQPVCRQFNLAYGPRIETSGTPVSGWWSRDELQRALENLVSNALKYGAPGTPVRILYGEDSGRLLLSVHNEGDAIPPDQVESVFQVFRRAQAAKDGDQQGWGIGLPYVRGVAESHGGSIDVDSSAERGTTFTIDIPLDARPYQDAPVLGQQRDL